MLQVRDATEDDRDAIERLAVAALDALSQSPSVAQWGGEMRRGFVTGWHPADPSGVDIVIAEMAGTVVGAASLQKGRRVEMSFLRLAVDPAFRRRGIGAALYGTLAPRFTQRVMVREMLSDHASVEFFEDRGFAVGETATEGTLHPGDARTAQWLADAKRTAGFTVQRAGDADAPAVAGAISDLYDWIHPWSPPRSLRDDEKLAVYLGAARGDAVFVAHRGGELVGAAALSESEFAPSPDLVSLLWCGVRDPEIAAAAAITRSLAAHCLEFALARSWTVEVKYNSPHTYLRDVIDAVPGVRLFTDLVILVREPHG